MISTFSHGVKSSYRIHLRTLSHSFFVKSFPRRLSGSPIAKRGPRVGLPKRLQTDKRVNMTLSDMASIINAERFSADIGLPLTAHLTVVWRNPEFDGENAECWEKEHRKLTRAMRGFLAKHNVKTALVYVRERVIGRGGHTHYLIHLPQNGWDEIRASLEKYLIKQCKAWGYTDRHPVKITGNSLTNGIATQDQRKGLLRYLSKSLNPDEVISNGGTVEPLSSFLGINLEPHCTLPTKRTGSTENISQAARKADGFEDLSDPLSLAEATKGDEKPGRRVKFRHR